MIEPITAEPKEYVQNDGISKILLLTWEYPPNVVGGLSRHVHGLAGGLNQKGYEVHVLTANPGSLPSYENNERIQVHRVRPLKEKDPNFLHWILGLNLAMEQKARELSSYHDFELIHAHDWLVGACGLSLKESLKRPLITTIHATEHGRNNGIYTELQKFIREKEQQLVNGSDRVIVCSEYMKEELIQQFSISSERMAVIANGINKEVPLENPQSILEGLPVRESRRLIFSIGRMVKEKGFDTLIESANLIKERFPDVYFIIAGKGPMLEIYRKKVKESNLETFIHFPGFINDLQRSALFRKCTLAVFPSYYEPFGIVALEAMISGKPAVVSDTGGLKGIVKHGFSGLLMTPGDPSSFAEQAAYLLENADRANMIGANGKKVAESLFSWSRIAEETKRVFEETLISQKLKEV
ncbi:glycosyltransferase family 4 protein [Bacillus sp. ISL-47]|uniref:glycosyltransferase family 4 protein n=1 Tax=Bacillus sp. ISL-47 TaxID=2819130 RepID=UPI001BE7EE50|nr:glycosyltransferase family 4 protein [Bacillus sp. ISL-47]MBT2687128.1 glycosyltransferase family 4 protein [Bacillus sp. ISL-47]MBT2710478.1 glycosyltransferase family 4 protein [Pseudomonas sp. ISL-84]